MLGRRGAGLGRGGGGHGGGQGHRGGRRGGRGLEAESDEGDENSSENNEEPGGEGSLESLEELEDVAPEEDVVMPPAILDEQAALLEISDEIAANQGPEPEGPNGGAGVTAAADPTGGPTATIASC